jgi:hypothetical protein
VANDHVIKNTRFAILGIIREGAAEIELSQKAQCVGTEIRLAFNVS